MLSNLKNREKKDGNFKKRTDLHKYYQKAYHLYNWSTRGRGERPVQKNIFEEMTEKFPGLTEDIHVQI